jgi:hypothetical protein
MEKTSVVRVKFTNVGRNKRNWTRDFNAADVATAPADLEYQVAREALKNGGLMSRGVDALFDEGSTTTGTIIVGGWRTVGHFEVVETVVPA